MTGIISETAFSFIVHEPNEIIDLFNAISESSNFFKYRVISVSEWYELKTGWVRYFDDLSKFFGILFNATFPVSLIDSAVKKSELGLNPQIDGQLIRLPVPDLSEERRNEMKKMVKTMGEKCKVVVRNIRREANDQLKNCLLYTSDAADE